MNAPQIYGSSENGFNFQVDVRHTPQLIPLLRREIDEFRVHVGSSGTSFFPACDMFIVNTVSEQILREILGQCYARLEE